jgi:hypothetical protein
MVRVVPSRLAADAPAFLVYGIGGLAVPLVLLITWMRVRMPHADTRIVVGETAGAARK